MKTEWTPEEWNRRWASILEDRRVLEAEIAELRADAQMLRDRGHEVPAQHIDKAIHIAEELVETIDEAEAARADLYGELGAS